MFDADGINILWVMAGAAFITLFLISYIIYKLTCIQEIEEVEVVFDGSMEAMAKVDMLMKAKEDKIKALGQKYPSCKVKEIDTELIGEPTKVYLYPNCEMVTFRNANSARVVFAVSKH